MATNPHEPTAGELRQRLLHNQGRINRTQADALRRIDRADRALVHYALDLESPPLIACEAPEAELHSTNAAEVTCPRCVENQLFPKLVARGDWSAEPEGGYAVSAPVTEPPVITANDVLMVAADLLVDANYDYGKAIVDMTSQLLGAGPDDTILMTRILRSLAQGD